MSQNPRIHAERIRSYEPLIKNRARRFYRGQVRLQRDLVDLESTAREAVWRASEAHRDDGGASFGTYVQTVVFHALNSERRHLNKLKRSGFVVSLSRDDDEAPIVLVNDGPSPHAALDASERRQAVRAAVDALPERLKTIIERRYWRDETLEHIARSFQLTRERIRQLEAQAFDEMRPKLQHLWSGLEAA